MQFACLLPFLTVPPADPLLRRSPECLHEKRVEQEEVVESIEIRDDKVRRLLRVICMSGCISWCASTHTCTAYRWCVLVDRCHSECAANKMQ